MPWFRKKRDRELRERAHARITHYRTCIDAASASQNHKLWNEARKKWAEAARGELDKAEKLLGEARRRSWSWVVDRPLTEADTHIDMAYILLPRILPADEVSGMIPRLASMTRTYLPDNDDRRRRVENVAKMVDEDCKKKQGYDEKERAVLVEAAIAAFRVLHDDRIRTSNFVDNLLRWTVGFTVVAVAIAMLGALWEDVMPLCFTMFEGTDQAICPTEQGPIDESEDDAYNELASRWDYVLVEGLGALGAAVTAAAAFRRLGGSPTAYEVPLALTLLKLPLGALVAVLGILLLRGEVVPGLTALDTPAQILAWAVIFGSAQQLFTHFVDNQGKSLMGSLTIPHAMLSSRGRGNPDE